LYPNTQFPHFAHFIGSAQAVLNQTLSSAIATQLATLPLISPAAGFTYKYDRDAGAFVRTTNGFGPIYSERAETIGRGKVSFGVSYQRFRFGSLDGQDLHNIPAVFSHVPNSFNGQSQPYEADVIKTTNNIDLNMDQTMLFGTVGITNRLDFSVAIPIVSVRMGASSDATIVRVSGPTFVIGSTTFANPHSFGPDPNSLFNVFSSKGSASGLGDVSFRIKGNVIQREGIRVALALDVRAPTGDARQLLGSGATGLKPFIIVSAGKRFSPHVNFGYQWNSQSILAGDVTGTSFGENSSGQTTITNGPAVSHNLPRELLYSVGADYGVTSKLSLAAEYLGQLVLNAPVIAADTDITKNIVGGTGAISIPTIKAVKENIGLNTGSVGFKYNLFGNLLLTGNILFRLDNNGLRQDITPLVALSYGFGH
jgi:hypothetical protein